MSTGLSYLTRDTVGGIILAESLGRYKVTIDFSTDRPNFGKEMLGGRRFGWGCEHGRPRPARCHYILYHTRPPPPQHPRAPDPRLHPTPILTLDTLRSGEFRTVRYDSLLILSDGETPLTVLCVNFGASDAKPHRCLCGNRLRFAGSGRGGVKFSGLTCGSSAQQGLPSTPFPSNFQFVFSKTNQTETCQPRGNWSAKTQSK